MKFPVMRHNVLLACTQFPLRRINLYLLGKCQFGLTPNWEVWYIHQKAVLPFSVTWAGWRAGQRGT